ncbi:unnamed protein product [Rhodiola kirilowii]
MGEGRVEDINTRFQDELVLTVGRERWMKVEQGFRWVAVLKLATGRPFKIPAMATAMNGAWNLSKDAEFVAFSDNVALVKFFSEEDMRRVLEGGPWWFKGWAILLQKWWKGMKPSDVNQRKIEISMQMHEVPIQIRDKTTAKDVANEVGGLVEREGTKNVEVKGTYLRDRIELPVDEPIRRGLLLRFPDGMPDQWITFSYERLPNVCF